MLDDVRSALSRLQKATDARSGLQEAIALDGLRATLEQKHDSLRAAVDRSRFLRSKGVQRELSVELSGSRKAVQTLAGQFEKEPSAATLKRGQRWARLIGALEELESNITDGQHASWESYCNNHFFSGAPPAEIRSRLAQTPSNTRALAKYETLFATFAACRKRVPQTDAEFEEAGRVSKDLEQVKFQENVPPSVAAFFSAAASGGGASLTLLSPEVLEWLKSNALLDRYIVRGRTV